MQNMCNTIRMDLINDINVYSLTLKAMSIQYVVEHVSFLCKNTAEANMRLLQSVLDKSKG